MQSTATVGSFPEAADVPARRTPEPRLPLGPLADWIDRQPVDHAVLALRAGMTNDEVTAIARRHRRTVRLEFADRFLCANATHLLEVWPDLDDLLPIKEGRTAGQKGGPDA